MQEQEIPCNIDRRMFRGRRCWVAARSWVKGSFYAFHLDDNEISGEGYLQVTLPNWLVRYNELVEAVSSRGGNRGRFLGFVEVVFKREFTLLNTHYYMVYVFSSSNSLAVCTFGTTSELGRFPSIIHYFLQYSDLACLHSFPVLQNCKQVPFSSVIGELCSILTMQMEGGK